MSDEDFEKVDNNTDDINKKVNNNQQLSSDLSPGDRVAPGKVVGKNGKVERSAGREIVEGVQSSIEVGAAFASGGASAGAQGAAVGSATNASKAGTFAKGAQANKINKGASAPNSLKKRVNNNAKEGLVDKAKDKAADKIDKKAARNPLYKKKVEAVADKAKVLNSGVGTAKSALSGDVKGVKENAKNFIKSLEKEKLKKLRLIVVSLALAAFAIIIAVEFFVATLSDAWQNFDNKSRKIADNIEKLTNLYRGFGFDDSKSAFYKELNEIDNLYDNKLDIALILSTVFYSESMGFDTDYNNHYDVINGDPVTEMLDGDINGLITYLVQWQKDMLSEAENTYDDENGLVYNAQKIYRLRRLAAAMCSKDTSSEESMTLDEFLNNGSYKLGKTTKDLLDNIRSSTLEILIKGYKDYLKASHYYYLFHWDELSDDFNEFTESVDDGVVNIANSFKMLMKYVTFGFFDLTRIEYKSGQIVIYYHPYKVDKEKYDDYLKNYYFEDTPGIKELLPQSDAIRNEKKQSILDDIYRNKNLFKEIFLQYEEESSEEYVTACVGAIDNNLVSELSLPIDSGSNISFGDSESFGIVNGKKHNGVNLTSSNSGISKGDNVYSIADGKVVDVGDETDTTDTAVSDETDATEVTNKTTGKWIKIKHEDILVNETEYTFYSIYKNLDTTSVKKGDNVSKGDTIGAVGTSSEGVDQLYFEFRNEKGSAIDPTNLFVACVGSNGQLVGDTNEEKIWNYLTGTGYSKMSASGIMGNWQQESAFLPNNLEDGANKKSGLSDEEFTSQVNSGTIDRSTFIKSSRFGLYSGGRYGYGLAQWTDPSRKPRLYDYYKENSTDISDLKMQLDFYVYEKDNFYTTLDSSLESQTSPENAATTYCNIYEGGTAGAIRRSNARTIYEKYKNYVAPTVNLSDMGISSNTSNMAGKSDEEKISLVFPNGVPTSSSEVEQYLTDVECDTLSGKKSVKVHKAIAQDVVAACNAAKKEGFNIYSIGGYRTFGSDTAGRASGVGLNYSQHCYGLAVDINPTDNGQFKNGKATGNWHYYPNDSSYKNVTITQSTALYNTFISNGWGWGGNWTTSKDYMHFSFFGT